jgi:CPA1 family monovalent cation:H+ antiporter
MGVEALLVTFLAFLTAAVLVSYGASRLRLPYTVAMVLVGLCVSILRAITGHHLAGELEPELILLIFLPGLLFEASYHLDLHQLRANLRPILWLAIPGVLISALVVAFLARLGLRLSLVDALLFGVLISATDPIAVVALFKELGVDKRLGVVIEGESLFNDGVAIVGYTILVGIAAGTDSFSLVEGLIGFVVTVAGGATLGIAAGFLFAELMKRTDEPLINIALTTILAYGTYLLAEEGLHGLVSPVIAVVVAGVIVGNYGSSGRHSATSTTMIATVWEFVVFVINSAIFLLIGLQVEVTALLGRIGAVILIIAAVLVARAIVVYLLRLVINVKQPAIPLAWGHVMFWGGMRGAVGIALVLSLPAAIASRELLITLAFGYVLFSVVVQGLTIKPLLNRLGLTRGSEKERDFEESLSQMAAAQASIAALERMHQEHLLSGPIADHLRRRFEDRIQQHQLDINRLVAENPGLAEKNVRLVQRELAAAQKQSLLVLLRRGIISEEVHSGFTARIDEDLRQRSSQDWILSAELMEDLEEFLAQGSGSAV